MIFFLVRRRKCDDCVRVRMKRVERLDDNFLMFLRLVSCNGILMGKKNIRLLKKIDRSCFRKYRDYVRGPNRAHIIRRNFEKIERNVGIW